MLTAIIIPTYNEADNIKRLIKKLFVLYQTSIMVIVVDDNSPDGTGFTAEELKKSYKNLFVIKRKGKNGRGSAVIEGFKLAFNKKSVDYFIEMDADFSHKPEEISRLLEKVRKFDVVLGSRYRRGSKIYGWSLGRRVFSKFANFYCRLLLGIPISDYTNGFRCYKRNVVKLLLSIKLQSKGYIVLSETAYFLYKNGFKFDEVPTTFENRVRGKSNFSISEIKESLLSIPKIKQNYS